MKKTDRERLKKTVSTWESLSKQYNSEESLIEGVKKVLAEMPE